MIRSTLLGLALFTSTASAADLTRAEVVLPKEAPARVRKAATMLVEEVEKRSGLRWTIAETAATNGPRVEFVVIPTEGEADAIDVGLSDGGKVVRIVGDDRRGAIFGAGRLLRELRIAPGSVSLPEGFRAKENGVVPLRGHQLGYRPKTNSYDAWDLPQWEQYIRDLAVFGTNAIELIPPRSDDTPTSPHFPRPQMEMMVGMSRIADEYGLDVWVWYPALDKDYGDPAQVDFALKEWAGVLSRLPRLDAVLVPGGDPGHTPPRQMFALLEKQTASIRRFHPQVQMWMSPQGFDAARFDEFLALMKEEPKWLTGIVYGPQVRMRLPELRKALAPKYPIRLYPDITHSLNCQYPVPNWDVAYSLTHERESINPRPTDMAAIFQATVGDSIGFLTYSEGCNDDVNKFVWSGLGWNPDAPVVEILRQYGRYFVSDRQAEGVAQGLLALERNWRGPLLGNASVETTLAQFQSMEKRATPRDLLNWRFQQMLYRAYYDGYVRDRLIRETAVESDAYRALRRAGTLGSLRAIDEAAALLQTVDASPASPDRRMRVYELGEALFQSARMQLSVAKHQGVNGRGTTLDTVELPLNDRPWLESRFVEIRKLKTEAERLAAIEALVDRTNPGPGGFYDDLGNLNRQPHLVPNAFSYAEDPDFRRSNYVGFEYRAGQVWPLAWCASTQALYATPIRMKYDGLDPTARYRIRIVYAVDNVRPKMRLDADGLEIHPLIAKPDPPGPIEFDVPAEATRDGSVTFTWTQEPGRGGNGRGCQIAEVWLIRP